MPVSAFMTRGRKSSLRGGYDSRERISCFSFFATSIAIVRHLRQHGAKRVITITLQGLLLLFSVGKHIAVLRVLSHPQCARLASKYPLLAFKYLGSYVALDLPLATRRSIFVNHFQLLQRKFAGGFLASMDGLPIAVWRKTIGQRRFDVTIGLNYVIEHEGDLVLVFRMDGIMVYRLMFVFASGHDFHLPDETIIIVSGVQGVHDFNRVKLATKTCCDLQPAHILMAALGGLAEVARVSTIVGLHQSRQLFGHNVRFSYDRFFEIYGTEMAGQRTYLIQVPYVEKPIASVETSHRRRTLRKRQFKADTRHQVVEALTAYLA
jgi:uncharacterized protein VirK/YbjX